MGELERDFLGRQIKKLVAALARALFGSREEGEHDHALEAIRRAAGEFLGVEDAILRQVDTATAAELLKEPLRIQGYAWLVAREAEVLDRQGKDAEAADLRDRALDLYDEATNRLVLKA